MRRSKRFLPIALFLVATTVLMSMPEETLAKPYACGKETCTPHETKANCQVCKSAVCDKDSKGNEYLVPGTATTTKCTEPGKREGPRGGTLPLPETPRSRERY
jgi:hypothetical protein